MPGTGSSFYPFSRRNHEQERAYQYLSEKLEIGEAAASEFVNLFFGSIQQALADGGRVEIRGFGSFELRQYEGYTGRDPKTGIVVDVQPKKLPFFKAGKRLKDFLNQDK